MGQCIEWIERLPSGSCWEGTSGFRLSWLHEWRWTVSFQKSSFQVDETGNALDFEATTNPITAVCTSSSIAWQICNLLNLWIAMNRNGSIQPLSILMYSTQEIWMEWLMLELEITTRNVMGNSGLHQHADRMFLNVYQLLPADMDGDWTSSWCGIMMQTEEGEQLGYRAWSLFEMSPVSH